MSKNVVTLKSGSEVTQINYAQLFFL